MSETTNGNESQKSDVTVDPVTAVLKVHLTLDALSYVPDDRPTGEEPRVRISRNTGEGPRVRISLLPDVVLDFDGNLFTDAEARIF